MMKRSDFNILFLLGIALLFSYCENDTTSNVTVDATPEPFVYEEITIDEIQEQFASGDLTVEKLVQAYLDRIEALDQNGPTLRSVIQVNPDALQIAKELDAELAAGKKRGPMHGIPVLLKDNLDTHDKMATTAGSRALSGSMPLQDSQVAESLRKAGAVILGKANLSEWANFRGDMSSSGWSGVGGQVKNPYVLDRNPCGSSSGSGVSVSANLCVLAIGTETNGSIVCPATTNGIVGIKPTVGLVSRSGVVPISFTQDTPGPMARTVKDAAICLGAINELDSRDAKTTAFAGERPTDYTQFLKVDGLKGKRIGWYKRPSGRHGKVDVLMEQTIEFLKTQGVEIIEIERIAQEQLNGASFQVMLYEFKDGLNQYLASLGDQAPIKDLAALIEFNKKDDIELKYFDQNLLIMAQEKGSLEDEAYQEALAKMTKGMQQDGIDRVMKEHKLDAFVAPTSGPAWKTDLVNGDNFSLGSSSPAAIAGYPNITVPMGFVEGLPVGVSFFGTAWSEPTLIEIAYAYEQGTMHRKAPQFLEH